MLHNESLQQRKLKSSHCKALQNRHEKDTNQEHILVIFIKNLIKNHFKLTQ